MANLVVIPSNNYHKLHFFPKFLKITKIMKILMIKLMDKLENFMFLINVLHHYHNFKVNLIQV